MAGFSSSVDSLFSNHSTWKRDGVSHAVIESLQTVDIRVRTVWILVIASLGLWAGIGLNDWWKARTIRIRYEEVFKPLDIPDYDETEGFWVGDIAENYRLGRISRQLAESDTAPLNPLVPKPVPFHGYYVRIMESGPSLSGENSAPVSFKGLKRSRDNFAILFYPDEHGPGKVSVIHSRLGVYRRSDDWVPTFAYPTDQERIANWAIVD